MRPLATRRITVLAVSAVLSLGTAAPALAAAPHPSTTADRAVHGPLPVDTGTDTASPARAEALDDLDDLDGVLTPVSELVAAALTAGAARPSAVDVAALKAKVAAFVAEAMAGVPALPALPVPASPPSVLPAPASQLPALPAVPPPSVG
ncbi:hypothetical protein EAO70_29965 [Streptomyces sp. adm13(2018)]|uniref:hypothetical protein n=1 Tax=Streptomyces sp. adm13(2018) TaxID=2479007 RepID=UPI0011CD6CB6|nr:hypothetical protein [Streptomyces sp. adm13(2018)]TXS11200.1 hypothetical protein EAO70_29965 [Streptomyces sp. adm13(2018)]